MGNNKKFAIKNTNNNTLEFEISDKLSNEFEQAQKDYLTSFAYQRKYYYDIWR